MFRCILRRPTGLAPPQTPAARRCTSAALVWIALLCPTAVADNPIIYVNAAAPPGGDGTSWATAFHDLQDAIALAESRDGADSIWVARGTYKPDRGTLNASLNFLVTTEIFLYGGFRGFESSLEERPSPPIDSILSGDLLGNDDTGGTPAENTRWLLVAQTGARLVLDGFSLAAGVQNNLLVQHSSLRLEDCTFRNGGEARIDWSDWEAIRCRWTAGSRGVTAFVAYGGSTPGRTHKLHDCSFDNATLAVTDVNAGPGSVLLEGCDFHNATEPVALRVFHAAIRDCSFQFNRNPFRFCVRIDASRSGPSLPTDHSTVVVEKCDFLNNSCAGLSVGSLLGSDRCTMVVSDCGFFENSSDVPTLHIRKYRFLVERTSFVRNTTDIFDGGGIGLNHDDTMAGVIRFCDFIENASVRAGGGIAGHCAIPFNAIPVVNCRFIGNTASTWGGAVNCMNGPFINCVFACNEAQFGSAAYLAADATPRSHFVNCTIVDNYGSPTVGVNSPNYLDNCIVFGNQTRDGSGVPFYASTTPRHSNVQGLSPPFTNGNFSAPPEFVNPAVFDYRLRPSSPCIDAGSAALLPADLADLDDDMDTTEPLPWDLAGEPRVFGNQVDVGAYEWVRIVGDVNCDGVVSVADVTPFVLLLTDPAAYATEYPNCDPLSGDMNANGVVNVADIGGFVSLLANG